MAKEFRKTGISVVGDLPWGTHFCTFYETKQDLLDILVPYFKTGLESKEFCLWIISNSELITTEEAKEALGETVPDLDRYLAEGRIEIVSHDQWFLKNGAFDFHRVAYGFKEKLDEALANGYAGLRINGSPAWIQAEDANVLREFEGEADHFFANEYIIASCTYPLGESRTDFLLDVARNHQFTIARRNGKWDVLETPQLIQAKQEIQSLNEELEQRVIERTRELAAANEELKREIAERQRAEDALRGSEDRLRLVIDTVPALIHTGLPDGQLDFFNQRWLDFVGLSLEDLSGWKWTAAIHPEDVAAMVERWRAALATGEPYEHEARVRRADGEYRWMVHREVPLRDEWGNIVKWYASSIDIEDRKRAEEALRQNENGLRLVLETLPVGVSVTNRTGDIVLVNAASKRIWGGTIAGGHERWEQTKGYWHDSGQRIAPESWASVRALFKGETSLNELIDIETYQGQRKIIRNSAAPVRDSEGLIVGAIIVNEDVTNRVRAEEALNESETKLKQAQRLAHVGSWDWDLRTNKVTWSDELYRIFGLEPGTIMVAGDATSFIHPDDQDLVWSTVQGAVANKERYSFYYRALRPDGTERIVHSRGAVLTDEHGEPIRVFGATQDVTERKQAEAAQREAEQKYRDIFENAGEGIFQSTPDGRFIAANPALALMYGFASAEDLIQSLQDISLQVYVDPVRREEFKRQIEAQGAVRGFEHEVFRQDGGRLWISVNAHAVRDAQGAVQYYEGTAQDISERKVAEEKMKATSEQLRALSASIQSAKEEEGTRIAREIHDELGATLSSLRWELEEVGEVISGSRYPSQSGELRKKIESMLTLTDTAVNEVRRIASELRPTALDELGLSEAIEWQARQFQERTGIVVQCDCALEAIELKREQSTAVFRIFQEALTNILRHAQATRVSIRMKEEDGEFILTITDNGRGITDAEKLGQRTLGLMGMRERAHLIGGEVDITGSNGKGTVVTVRITTSTQESLPNQSAE
jgi:PAS domain S-box-containing protein